MPVSESSTAQPNNLVRNTVERSKTSEPSVLRDRNLHIVFASTLMAILGVSSISPALPQIVRELEISRHAIGLLITAFTLPGVILAPVSGVLADRFGRRKILAPALLLFGIAGGMCTFVDDFAVLVALRFVQGIGGAALGVLNVTIIGDLFEGKRRAAAMGYNASVLSVGTGSYPIIGGALAVIGWHYPFALAFLALPIGALVWFALDSPEPKSQSSMRIYAAGIWTVLKDRRTIAIILASIGTFVILYGSYLTYFPILLGERFGASSALIGLIMASMSFTTAVTSSQLGRLREHFNEITVLRTAFFVYAIALAIIPFISNIWLIFIPTVIYGIGHGISIPTQMTIQAGLAPAEQRAAFMAIVGMVLRGGQTIGPLIIGAVYAFGGENAAFFAGAAIALLVILLLIVLFPKRRQ